MRQRLCHLFKKFVENGISYQAISPLKLLLTFILQRIEILFELIMALLPKLYL